MPTILRRSRIAVAGVTVIFVAGMAAVAGALIRNAEHDAMQAARQRSARLINSAESDINRGLLAVDVMLAGTRELLNPALQRNGQLDKALSAQLLRAAINRNLLISDLMLVDATGTVMVAGLGNRTKLASPLPPAFVNKVMGQAAPQMLVSQPTLNFATAENALFFARPVDWPGVGRLLVVAEVPVAQMAAVLDRDADSDGVQMTLEHNDGELLVMVPEQTALAGRRLSPPLNRANSTGLAQPMAARLDGQDALVAVRPTLYPQLLISASLPTRQALLPARQQRPVVLLVTGGFILLVLASAATALWFLQITHRARAGAEQSRQTLDKALAAMADGFLLCDANERVVAWNPRYEAIFPWLRGVLRRGTPYETLACTAVQAIHPELPDNEQRRWVQARLDAHRRPEGHLEQQLPSGMVIHAIERRMPDGGVVSVFRDITSSEQTLAQAKADAEAANEAKSRFLAQMSHEIRTPLNAVLGTNGLLLASGLNDDQRRLCELMRQSGQALLAVINDILDLSKIEAGRMTLEIVSFNPLGTVNDVVQLLSVRAQAQGLGLHLEGHALPPLMGDPSRLRQILFNLIGNALKFTDRGEVRVRLSATPLTDGQMQLCIEVQDTGIGIAPEMLPTLFERFLQGDSRTARRYGGSGLGLAISHDLAVLMGGRIEAHSVLGQGSTFRVTLPLPLAHEAPQVAPALPAPTSIGALRRRILVAEDNGVNQILIKAMLDRLGHYCDIVANGVEAVRQVQASQYDLVLMDIQMPEMDGEAATRAIRALPGAVRKVPIVAMTAHAMAEHRQASEAAGMNGHLSKPVDLAVLADMIRRMAP
ncbi:MAG: hypothetical protein CFE46_01080 [Burkholderiales bacterium PBB6]|nr:MAG: hypothetical protein CFE46_01080 [Burkholderiales bacterium PBB6]